MIELYPNLWKVTHDHYDNPNYHFLSAEMYLKFFTSTHGEQVERMWGLD